MTFTVVIAGITSQLAQLIAASLLSKHPTALIKGTSRDPSKLPTALRFSPNVSLVKTGISDVKILRSVVRGADVVICCYFAKNTTMVDGQKVLIDLCEEEGVPRYIASDYTADHRGLEFGQIPMKDPMKEIQSYLYSKKVVKGVHILVGLLMETFWTGFDMLDSETKTLRHFGTGSEKFDFTSYKTAAVAADESAVGFLKFRGDRLSLREVAAEVETVYGFKPTLARFNEDEDPTPMLVTLSNSKFQPEIDCFALQANLESSPSDVVLFLDCGFCTGSLRDVRDDVSSWLHAVSSSPSRRMEILATPGSMSADDATFRKALIETLASNSGESVRIDQVRREIHQRLDHPLDPRYANLSRDSDHSSIAVLPSEQVNLDLTLNRQLNSGNHQGLKICADKAPWQIKSFKFLRTEEQDHDEGQKRISAVVDVAKQSDLSEKNIFSWIKRAPPYVVAIKNQGSMLSSKDKPDHEQVAAIVQIWNQSSSFGTDLTTRDGKYNKIVVLPMKWELDGFSDTDIISDELRDLYKVFETSFDHCELNLDRPNPIPLPVHEVIPYNVDSTTPRPRNLGVGPKETAAYVKKTLQCGVDFLGWAFAKVPICQGDERREWKDVGSAKMMTVGETLKELQTLP